MLIALRRIGLKRPPTGESRILDGVLPPADLDVGTSSLTRALMRTVEHAGLSAGYDALMGLTGQAYTVPLCRLDLASAEQIGGALRVAEGLSALGLTGHVCVVGQDGADISRTVRQAIDAGFPAPVLGWPEERSDWGLVTGYDLGRGVFCGWPAGHSGEAYLGHAPSGQAAVVIESLGEPSPFDTALHDALTWAAGQAPALSEWYGRWRAALTGNWPEADEPAQTALIARHEAYSEALADARTAAAAFLSHCAGALSPVSEQWALVAAEAYTAIVEQLDARQPQVLDSHRAEAFASEQERDEWAAALAEVESLEIAALGDLHKCLSSTVGPGDLDDSPTP